MPASRRPRRRLPGAAAFVWAAVLAFSCARAASALEPTSLDLELDPYYTSLDWTVPFKKGADETDVEKGEVNTYRDMLREAVVPRFMVVEASLNPLPLLGTLVRDRSESTYQNAQLGPSFNLLEAVTAGFEEPWALGIFLGKVIDFSRGEKTLGRAQKGYVGYVVSAGNEHIMNCLLIPDDWVEAEWKVKGDMKNDERKMSWSFRGGAKVHSNKDIQDTYYVALRRSRTDFRDSRWAFLLNSAVEYRLDVSTFNLRPISQLVLIEKNFPIPSRKWTFSLGVGYRWIGQDKYTGALALQRRNNESQVLFRPNLKF